MRRLITATCLVALLASCSQETVSIEQKADVQENALPKGMVEVDLTKYGIGAQLMVPGKSRTGVDPTISLDEVTSHVNIRSGKNYNVCSIKRACRTALASIITSPQSLLKAL